MKKLMIVTLMIGMASVANADLEISVNGIVYEDNHWLPMYGGRNDVIGIWGDGQTTPGAFFVGIDTWGSQFGSLDISGAEILYEGSEAGIVWVNDPDTASYCGIYNPFVGIWLYDFVPPEDPLGPGMLVDQIIFHEYDIAIATITLFDESFYPLDSQVFFMPEPMTVVLLGLGSLMLRRRR
jgi:hypothetical protein